jgi:hypothetical protein
LIHGRWVLLAAALTAGCGHGVAAVRPADRPLPAPEVLFQALVARQTALRTVELETKTTSWLGHERTRATVLMLVERSGRLRFEADVPLQGAVASLVVRGREFQFLDLQQHVFRHGPACPANVALMIPIPLLPEEIAAILLGDAPLGEGARPGEVLWDGERRADVLVVDRPSAGAAARLWISFTPSGSSYDVVAVAGESPAGAGRRWRVAYEGSTRIDAGAPLTLPGTIRFAEPGRSFDDGVEIKVKERMGVNRPLRDESFVLTPPAGYPVETLGCPPAPTSTRAADPGAPGSPPPRR